MACTVSTCPPTMPKWSFITLSGGTITLVVQLAAQHRVVLGEGVVVDAVDDVLHLTLPGCVDHGEAPLAEVSAETVHVSPRPVLSMMIASLIP